MMLINNRMPSRIVQAACWLMLLIGAIVSFDCQAYSSEKPSVHQESYRVKATFIFSFANFIEWPAASFAGDQAPIEIGIFGKDPFGKMIDDLAHSSTARGRAFIIRRAQQLSALQSCHIIFISRSESKFLGRSLNDLETRPVLTISDIDHFAQRGGLIGFVMRHEKVHFQINIKGVKRSGLKISSRILHLADITEGSVEDSEL